MRTRNHERARARNTIRAGAANSAAPFESLAFKRESPSAACQRAHTLASSSSKIIPVVRLSIRSAADSLGSEFGMSGASGLLTHCEHSRLARSAKIDKRLRSRMPLQRAAKKPARFMRAGFAMRGNQRTRNHARRRRLKYRGGSWRRCVVDPTRAPRQRKLPRGYLACQHVPGVG